MECPLFGKSPAQLTFEKMLGRFNPKLKRKVGVILCEYSTSLNNIKGLEEETLVASLLYEYNKGRMLTLLKKHKTNADVLSYAENTIQTIRKNG